MKTYRRCICCLLSFVLFALFVNAQERQSLRGQVLDTHGTAIAGAVVSCIELPDSTVVTYGVTSDDGVFQLEGLREAYDKYLLEVSIIGYDKAYIKPISGENVITLKASAIALKEVVVTASAPRLRQKPGKFIYKPRFSEVKGMDSYDILRYTPLITLENNSVSILGKGRSTIYINGRKAIMDNSSLMEMLRATPANQIEHIEIIMSPNSSYSASTTGGIVNIVMKKNPNQGWTGSASISSTDLGEKISPRASLYLGYSKNKFNASANFSYLYTNVEDETDATYHYTDTFTSIFNSNLQKTSGHFLNGNVNFTYDLTKKGTIGASFHMGESKSNSHSTTKSLNYLKAILDKSSISVDQTDHPFRRPEIGVVAYYNLKTDNNGSNLDLSANYSSSINELWGKMEYANATNENNLIPFAQFQQNSSVDSYGYEFKGSYSHYINEDNQLKVGYNFNASHLTNDLIRNDFDGNDYIPNGAYCNHFIYEEKVNALYLTFDKKWSDVLSTTCGLRAENTNIHGHQVTSGEKFRRNYWNFFPNLSVLMDLADGEHSIALDLSRSILRPFYNDLNPFKIWSSDNTYTMGNIHIKPMLYTDVDLSYSFCNDYIIGASYNYGSDTFSEYTYSAGNNTTVNSVANFGHEQELSLYFNMDKIFFKGFWRMSCSAGTDYEITTGNIEGKDIGYKTWMGTAGIHNVFKITPKGSMMATMNYDYYTPSRGILKKGRNKHLLNVSLSKDFRFGGTLSIYALNLLNYKPSYYSTTDTYSYHITPKTNNISFQIRFTYKFGKNRVRGAKDRSETTHLERFKK